MRLLDRFFSGRAKAGQFHGGLHVPAHKTMSTTGPASVLPLSAQYRLSLKQRDGGWLDPQVSVGARVLAGQLLAEPATKSGIYLHAPTSGVIREIAPLADINHTGQPGLCIVLDADGKDRWTDALPALNESAPPKALLARIEACGICGLGGAGFSTARKLAHHNQTLVVNAAECEPYITCDDMQLREHAPAIVRGAQFSAHILQASTIVFGIEDDKPQAISALEEAIAQAEDKRIRLQVIPARYPSGNSRQLFELLLGIRVPGDQHASDFGLVCHNSATMKAVYDAVHGGRPLIERYVTVTGERVHTPQVFIARIGTPLDELIAAAGGALPGAQLLIGGPMMGEPQQDTSAGLHKTTNCLLFLPKTSTDNALECIRCAKCSEACPMELLPQQLYWYSRTLSEDRLRKERLFDCIECGICASVCPSNIPLVAYYRDSKLALRESERQQASAERAKARHLAREARLQREAEERKARMEAKRAALQQKNTAQPESLSAPPEKAPAKDGTPSGVFNPTARPAADDSAVAKQAVIEAAKARAAARRQQRQAAKGNPPERHSESENAQSSSVEDREAKLAQAKAKAEARRAQRQKSASETPAPQMDAAENEREAKLAEAKAKAEARRAQRQKSASETPAPQTDAAENEREAKLAEAKAKAEARRAQRQKSASETPAPQTDAAENEREAKLAEAKAKAEARRQARQQQKEQRKDSQ